MSEIIHNSEAFSIYLEGKPYFTGYQRGDQVGWDSLDLPRDILV